MIQELLESIPFKDIAVGQNASISKTLSKEDIELFALVSGDVNPAHLDETYAKTDMFHGIVGHGMWVGALISNVLGTVLPGPGTIYLEQDIKFKNPVRIGDEITTKVSVKAKRSDKPVVTFDCICVNQNGDTVAEGTAVVLAPTEKTHIPRPNLPDIDIHEHNDHFLTLIKSCSALQPIRTAIVHPVESHIIEAVAQAAKEQFIIPVFIGPGARIRKAAAEAGIDISAWELIGTEHSFAAAQKSVELAAHGQIDAIMKGALHTDELLKAIVPSSSGLRTERRISHAYVMDIPSYHKPLIITDAAINIDPDLEIKADICRNAINLWRTLYGDSKKPKIAILAAVETVNSKMRATLDAAALCKMADRGQITNAIIDGPLAFDVAINKEAAKEKGLVSVVAGDADILVMPDIEAGNIVSKQLTFMANVDAAGIVLGARVPIILTSRADSERSRFLSCVLAAQLSRARCEGRIK